MISKPNLHEPNNLPKVIYIAFSFMILFSAFSITQSLISHMYKTFGFTNLGQICLFFLYIGNTTGNIITPFFQRQMSVTKGLIIGGIPYGLFVFGGALTTYCNKYNLTEFICSEGSIYFYNILFSTLVGFGAAFIWLSQATYVNGCTSETNKGTYHGIFWSIMQSSMLIGSSMAAFVLGNADELTFYSFLTCLSALAIVMFYFLTPLPNENERIKIVHNETFKDSARKTLKCFIIPEYMPVAASAFLSGITACGMITQLPLIVRSTIPAEEADNVNQKIAFVLMALGSGQIMSGFSTGRLLDKFANSRIEQYIFAHIEFVSCLAILTSLVGSYSLSFLAGMLWGINDNAMKTYINTLISAKYKGKLELFAMNRAAQCIAVVIGTLCGLFLSEAFGKFYMLVILAFQVGCHVIFNRSYKNIKPVELNIELLPRS